mmetsp:Transcript_57012/g.137829  ORF Transcript_57012/g.137829 Transcript_57012/m.137829 type:complete len:209 (+) Transcript_57012:1790-2416(+)
MFREVGLVMPRPCDHRPCRRPTRAVGLALMTMSTSGTATPKAVPLARLPLAKPATSASGMIERMAFFTSRAICATAMSLSVVGAIRPRSSDTSASQPTASNVGAATGMALGRRTSTEDLHDFSSAPGAARPGGGPSKGPHGRSTRPRGRVAAWPARPVTVGFRGTDGEGQDEGEPCWRRGRAGGARICFAVLSTERRSIPDCRVWMTR